MEPRSQGLHSTTSRTSFFLELEEERPSERGSAMKHSGKVREPVLSFIAVLETEFIFRQTLMIKMVVFCMVAGTVTTPGTPPLPQPGQAAWPSWSSSGRRRM